MLQVAQLLTKPGFLKQTFGAKSPLIRNASYAFVKEVVSCLQAAPAAQATAADAPASDEARAASPAPSEAEAGGREAARAAVAGAEVAAAVLGAVGDKDPGNHGGMWALQLTYLKVRPFDAEPIHSAWERKREGQLVRCVTRPRLCCARDRREGGTEDEGGTARPVPAGMDAGACTQAPS